MKSLPNPTRSLLLPVLIALRALIYLLFVQAFDYVYRLPGRAGSPAAHGVHL